jgi:hypothetical protein
LTTAALRSPVVNVGNYAFRECRNLSIPELTVTGSIGHTAFYNCKELKKVNASMVTGTIGEFTFNGCTNLTEVKIPLVTSIGNYAFQSCPGLTTVDLSSATTIGNYAFNGCTSLTTVDLPSVTTIGTNAFRNCTTLATLKLGYAGPFAALPDLFGAGNDARSKTITLYLRPGVSPAPVGNTWNGYTWKEILTYNP